MPTSPACPPPRLAGVLPTPIVPAVARVHGASRPQVRRDLDRLPLESRITGAAERRSIATNAASSLLAEVDRPIAQDVIGGDQRNAADFQIAPSVRMLLAMTDIAHLIADRSAATLARRVVVDDPVIPAALRTDWLPAAWASAAQPHQEASQERPR